VEAIGSDGENVAQAKKGARVKTSMTFHSYYTIQAVATVLSGAKSDASIRGTTDGDAPELYCEPLRGREGEILVAVWSAIPPQEDYEGKHISLNVAVADPKLVEAVDTLHAIIQGIRYAKTGDGIRIDGLLVPDYPIIVRIR
jgi:hypothetical protein